MILGFLPTWLSAVVLTDFLLSVSLDLPAADVRHVQKVSVKNNAPGDFAFGIDDILQVEITGLSSWRKSAPSDQRDLTIYVDDVPLACNPDL